MLNELEEFKAYTTPVKYEVSRKGDTAFLGRFTFESLLNFEGLGRILTILARGYLPDINRARNALCAWCSIPDSKNATPKEEWQNRTDFRGLSEEFPELVDENGAGWFYRHVHSIAKFVLDHPDAVRKGYTEYAEAIQNKFDKMWRDKVLQFQTPIFSLNTKGAWTLRFDNILADALEQGPLQNHEVTIPDELRQRVEKLSDKKAAPYICDLIAYYHPHKEDDCDWVILPVTSFDMCTMAAVILVSAFCPPSRREYWNGRAIWAPVATALRKNSCHKFVTLATCNSPFSKVTSPKTFGRYYHGNIF